MKRLRLPSPALVISLVALFVALGGSAYALTVNGADIVNGTITNSKIKQRSLTGTKFQEQSIGGDAIKASSLKKRTFRGTLFQLESIGGNAVKESTFGPVPQANGATLQAAVSGQGALVAGRGVAANGVARNAEGNYQVTFGVPVSACAFSATLADSTGATTPLGQIGTSTVAANPAAVAVRTANAQGAVADRPFHLVLSC